MAERIDIYTVQEDVSDFIVVFSFSYSLNTLSFLLCIGAGFPLICKS